MSQQNLFIEVGHGILYDTFEDEVMKQVGDKIHVEIVLPESDWLCGFIFSFGDSVKVLEPASLKATVSEKMTKCISTHRKIR